ncbi:unnamed protein product [Cylindrotheca closterium]|uniref:Uncharacterized protein n=1 Tax=Cylindrotheca closterium TaxID=2856 RepID=A0AAD2FUR9_9STRA|nr:unnamed protein product [Cylindrotheca closterium]
MRRPKLRNATRLDETHETIGFDGNQNHIPNRRRAGTDDSADTFTSASSSRQCLGDALKDCGDFHFDMSDRWKTALMEALDQPMFPDEDQVLPRHRRLRKGVTNFVKKRAQGLRRDSRRDVLDHQPVSPMAMN